MSSSVVTLVTPHYSAIRAAGSSAGRLAHAADAYVYHLTAAPFTFQTRSVGPPLARVLQKCSAAADVENKMGAAQVPYLERTVPKRLSDMPKNKPTAGPVRTQPIECASKIATPVLPMMPTAGKIEEGRTTKAKTNKDRCRPCREGGTTAAQHLSEAARRPEGLPAVKSIPLIHIRNSGPRAVK